MSLNCVVNIGRVFSTYIYDSVFVVWRLCRALNCRRPPQQATIEAIIGSYVNPILIWRLVARSVFHGIC